LSNKILAKDGKITQKSEFETILRSTIISEITNGLYSSNEMVLLWLYCKAWGAHGEHILSYNFFWKFNRDNLRKVLSDLGFPDPDEVPVVIQASNDLVNLLKAKLENQNQNMIEWLNLIHETSIQTIPKREYNCENLLLNKQL